MRITAIILAALGGVALYVGIFIYCVSSLLSCLDFCPPVDGLGGAWLTRSAMYLSPGLILTLIASILAIISLARERRRISLIVAIAAPLITAGLIALIMLLVAGSFAPVAGPTLSDGTVLVSSAWITGASYAAIPLALWPLATFGVVMVRAATV